MHQRGTPASADVDKNSPYGCRTTDKEALGKLRDHFYQQDYFRLGYALTYLRSFKP